MLKLYYSARTRAVRPRWLLEELEVPYELVRLNLSDIAQSNPGYLAIHPHGAVPALQDGELTLIESGAICSYLAEKHAVGKLAPSIGSAARPLYLQWMFYCPGTFEAPFTQLFQQTRGLPETDRSPALAEKARAEFGEVVSFIDRSLAGRQFLLGDQFSTADIMLGHSLLNARRYEMLRGVPNLEEYLNRLDARPARKRATQD
jgi:glutathione S-transferase